MLKNVTKMYWESENIQNSDMDFHTCSRSNQNF